MIFREGNIARANFARAKEESEISFATFLSFCFFFFYSWFDQFSRIIRRANTQFSRSLTPPISMRYK